MFDRLGRAAWIAAKLYLASLLATYPAMYASVRVAMFPQAPEVFPGLFDDIGTLLDWSVILFIGAVGIGLPIAAWTFRIVKSPMARIGVLLAAGMAVNFVIFALLVGHPLGGLIAAPAAAILVVACCLLNLRLLAQPHPLSLNNRSLPSA